MGKSSLFPGQGIEKCANICHNLDECTSFEYKHDGGKDFKCETYTNGKKNVRNEIQSYSWTSCIKGINISQILKMSAYLHRIMQEL